MCSLHNAHQILGEYIAKRGPAQRDELVIASKVAGYSPSSRIAAARSYPNAPIDPAPDCRLDGTSVKDAAHASLRRLQTDRIDLMQIHWPDRYVPSFGMTTYHHDMERKGDEVPIMETASALKDLIDEGKVRYIGLSNESTYGVCEWVRACRELGIEDKLASIQNPTTSSTGGSTPSWPRRAIATALGCSRGPSSPGAS